MSRRDDILRALKSLSREKFKEEGKKFPSTFCFREKMSKKQMKNALSDYAEGVGEDEVLAFYDDTVLGNGKLGYLFTENGIYYKHSKMEYSHSGISRETFIRYDGITAVHKNENDVLSLEVDGEEIGFNLGSYFMDWWYEVFSDIIAAVHEGKDVPLRETSRSENAVDLAAESVVAKPRATEPAGVESAMTTSGGMDEDDVEESEELEEEGYVRGGLFDADEDGDESEEPESAGMGRYEAEQVFSETLRLREMGNYDLAFQHVRPAAEAGLEKAQVMYGRMHQKGEGTKENPAMALYWYEKAAGQGHEDAIEKKKYIEGLDFLTRDMARRAEVLKRYKRAYAEVVELIEREEYDAAFAKVGPIAEAGVGAAQFTYGLMYCDGMGTKRDMEKAIYWVEAAARNGVESAWKLCGELYSKIGLSRNVEKALYWYEKAAMKGDVQAQLYCYTLANDKTGDEKKKALEWLEKAVAKDYPLAQYYWGYELVDKNRAEALKWFEKAAARGEVHGQFWCAQMYYYGYGTGKNKAKAMEWYEKFCAQGDKSAVTECFLLFNKKFDVIGNELGNEYFKEKYGVSAEEARKIMNE